MSPEYIKMWQGEINMDNYTVSDVIRELDISKSYLYKIIEKENIILPKSKTGRYFWNKESVNYIKSFLENETDKN